MARAIQIIGLGLVAFIALFLIWFYESYGGHGMPFPKMATEPTLPPGAVEIVATMDMPPGNLAVAPDGRLFTTIHAEAHPDIKVVEIKDGKPVPYPDLAFQTFDYNKPSFGAVFSLRIDSKNRLWTLDHGEHGIYGVRIMAFDLATNKLVHEVTLPREVASYGSFAQDFQVDSTGRYLFIADIGVFSGHAALIVYDSETKRARRLLDNHPAIVAEPYVINAQGREMMLLAGFYWMHPSFDPIGLDRRDEWLYVGPMSGKTLSRVRVKDLLDESLTPAALGAKIEAYATRAQSDGITLDDEDNIYLTGVEDGVIFRLDKDRKLTTYAKHPKMRWPDGLSFGPDQWLYIADSDIPDLIFQTPDHIKAAGPYYIFRVKAAAPARPGQ